MIDGNYYLNLRQEEAKNFISLTKILPIDDKLSYNGHVYQLTNFDMQTLNLTRNSLGYTNEYSGPEKHKGDANRINMMDLAKIRSFIDSIQHELSHDFEITNRGKPYINDLNKIGLKLMSSNDVCVKSIGYILYASDKTEIRAYANGLYAYLSSKNIIIPKYTNLRHFDFFKILKELNNSLAFIKGNKNNKELLEKINLYLEKYHIGYDKLIEIGENTIKKWNKEAMRTINKYTKDAQIKFDYWTDAPLPRFI